MITVCKFGGTSLADADSIRRAASIVRSDPDRRYVVVSAPGKRFPGDDKVTDLLLQCQRLSAKKEEFSVPFSALRTRFEEIAQELGTGLSLKDAFDDLYACLRGGASADYAASRGEYFSGLIVSSFLGFPFVDAKDVIRFHGDRTPDYEQSVRALADVLKQYPRAVIPGFYGTGPDGSVFEACSEVIDTGTGDGSAVVVFALEDLDLLGDAELVVFEKAYEADAGGNITDVLIALHEDLEDEAQTVYIVAPEIPEPPAPELPGPEPPVDYDIPQTGDTGKIFIYAGAAVISFLLGLAFAFLRRKNKDDGGE